MAVTKKKTNRVVRDPSCEVKPSSSTTAAETPQQGVRDKSGHASRSKTKSLIHENQKTPTDGKTDSKMISTVRKRGIAKNDEQVGTTRAKSTIRTDRKQHLTQQRRLKIEEERMEHLRLNSNAVRHSRLKMQSNEQKIINEKSKFWAVYVEMGARLQLAFNLVMEIRARQKQIVLENISSKLITKHLKIYAAKKYKERLRKAMHVLNMGLVTIIRCWKERRRIRASAIVMSFLISLENKNSQTGGCLALIVKGKMWRVYRHRIISFQRLWRNHLQKVAAQVIAIDLQWTLAEQELQMREEQGAKDFDDLLSGRDSTLDEELLSRYPPLDINRSANSDATLVVHNPISFKENSKKKRRDTKENMVLKQSTHEQGRDILCQAHSHIVPTEIRHNIIRSVLRYLRRDYLTRKEQYSKDIAEYTKQHKQSISVALDSSSAHQHSCRTSSINNKSSIGSIEDSSGTKTQYTGPGDIQSRPIKPLFQIFLGQKALNALVELGKSQVEAIRKSWEPSNMDIDDLEYDGRCIAEIHIRSDSSEIHQ